ncbi:MAG: hypothetical protein V2J55_14480 [Candidatus Competibacteraceae bacterium]|jgi:type III secretion system regulator LcrR|nr:hypothetical protein [Candidatus Competibacteraceae bacterium]
MNDHTIDPLRSALEARGLAITDHHLYDDDPTSPYVGPRFRIRNCEMIYSWGMHGDLLLILYRRLEKTVSVRNPFADLIWFLGLATRPEFGVRRVLGYISIFDHHAENGLSRERLIRFYQQFFSAEWIQYDGDRWLYRDIEPLRARLAQVRHLATQLPV